MGIFNFSTPLSAVAVQTTRLLNQEVEMETLTKRLKRNILLGELGDSSQFSLMLSRYFLSK